MSTDPAGGGRRAQRRDAQSNRSRILAVAEEVFGEGGPAASTEEVARRAGVGIATVFRHFPTKAELLQAVLAGRLRRLHAQAEEQLAAAGPARAFFDFFALLVADSATKIAIGEALVDAGGDDNPEVIAASADLRAAIGELLVQAQRAGTVRGDIELPEAYALIVGTSRAASAAGLDHAVRDRVLTVIFDGLAPSQD